MELGEGWGCTSEGCRQGVAVHFNEIKVGRRSLVLGGLHLQTEEEQAGGSPSKVHRQHRHPHQSTESGMGQLHEPPGAERGGSCARGSSNAAGKLRGGKAGDEGEEVWGGHGSQAIQVGGMALLDRGQHPEVAHRPPTTTKYHKRLRRVVVEQGHLEGEQGEGVRGREIHK